jgi:hypothetical protein
MNISPRALSGARDTAFHKRITGTTPIPDTRNGHMLDLECGHRVMTFGSLDHAQERVLCTQCRDAHRAQNN